MKSKFIPSISSYIKYDFQDNCRNGFPIYNPKISSFYEYIFQLHLCLYSKDNGNYGILKLFRVVFFNLFIITNFIYLLYTTGARLILRCFLDKYKLDQIRRVESFLVDVYVFINMIIAIWSFYIGFMSYPLLFILFYINISMVSSYIAIILFSGNFREIPLNFQRSLLLLIFNYIQVIYSYAYYYFYFGQFLNNNITGKLFEISKSEALFYSINPTLVDSIVAKSDTTRWIIISHDVILFLLFGVAFVYFFNMITSQVAERKAK